MCYNCDWKGMTHNGAKELKFEENIQGYYIAYDTVNDRWYLTDVCGTEYVRVRIHNCPWCGKRLKGKTQKGELQQAPRGIIKGGKNAGLQKI